MNILKLVNIPKLLNKYITNHRIVRFYVDIFEGQYDISRREMIEVMQRKKKNDIRIKYAGCNPQQVTLQILGSGARGVPSSLFVSCDHAKYIFNCGEGTQRLAQEHHLRFARLENMFFTTPSWKNIGGLPGMALTTQSMGVPSITLHGAPGILDMFSAVKSFVLLKNLVVKDTPCNETDNYKDQSMSIRYVHLKSTNPDNDSDSGDEVVVDHTDYYAHEINGNGKRKAKYQGLVKKRSGHIGNRQKHGKTKGCIAYICKLHQRSGTLNLEKCVEKGVPPGPLLGILKAGKDVTLQNGTIVKTTEVCDPPLPGPVFIVLECPSEDYLDSLMNHEIFRLYQKTVDDPENRPHCIVHFTPENVLQNPRYIEWMSRFSNDTQHLILNEMNVGHNYAALQQSQYKINLLHPTIFPMIHDNNPVVEGTENSTESKSLKHLKIHRAKTCDAFHLRPSKGLEPTEMIIDRQSIIGGVLEIDGFCDALAELQTEINARSDIINKSPAYPKILMLGTGSCIPNKYRNTSGILMRIDEDTSILMDCGEGSTGQLMRFFGPSEIDKVLISIKAIYISHLHADHHLGLIGVLKARQRLTDEPVYLLAPIQIDSWLNFFHRKFENIAKTYTLVSLKTLHYYDRKISPAFYDELKKNLKLNNVVSVDVHHCPHAFAVAWELECGKKIVYSGDTRPSINVVTIGKDCDLLIHEATMEDELFDEAKKKLHSTISEALQIGKDMDAKFTLLTHFSQRYSKIPRLPNVEKIPENVGIAYDMMQFSMAELPLLPLFYPVLRLVFSQFCNELEERAQKRILRVKSISAYKDRHSSSTYT